MPRSAMWFCALLVLGACSATEPDQDPADPDPSQDSPSGPFLRGVITSRSPYLVGVNGGIDSLPAMFVDGVNIWPAERPCDAQARFWITGGTKVFRRAGRALIPLDTAALALGKRVTVWARGVVLLSCPPITHADEAEVEN